jgi:hypothetical protein
MADQRDQRLKEIEMILCEGGFLHPRMGSPSHPPCALCHWAVSLAEDLRSPKPATKTG